MPHIRQLLVQVPLSLVRRVSEIVVVLTALAVVVTWGVLVVAGLFSKTFVTDHLSTIEHSYTALLILCAIGFLAGLVGMFATRGGRPKH